MQALQIAALVVLSTFSSAAALAAESQTKDVLQPFGEFIDTINSPQAAAAAASARAAEPQAQSYLKSLYASVDPRAVKHSFVDANETAFDCIPIAQQPSLHGSTAPLPTPPDLPKALRTSAPPDDEEKMPANTSASEFDRFGNAMACADGTIPMARVTPERLARFSSLKEFFQKTPEGGAIPPRGPAVPPQVAATHRWAHAYEDSVPNLGGHSFLNLWDPVVGNAIFSLSQHWYTAGSGSGLQTLETGWQVYPQQYKTKKPVLFIYWTADGYNNTGCYNLTCGAFVQTSSAWALGGALKPWSVGKKQYTIELTYFLNQAQGRWWLYVNGTTAANAIGYYPASLYGGGPLSFGANNIDYGGEVVGTRRWPPMGSGRFAARGYGKAAYQSDIYYFPPGGGIQNASLTPSQLWPWDFTVTANVYSSPFLETIFFGGPGGRR